MTTCHEDNPFVLVGVTDTATRVRFAELLYKPLKALLLNWETMFCMCFSLCRPGSSTPA